MTHRRPRFQSILCVFLASIGLSRLAAADSRVSCGGTLTATHGVIQTPNFPDPFPVPLTCRWIIDASHIETTNTQSIVVYLTQLYVFTGLTFHEYADYQSESVNFAARLIHTVTEQNVTRVRWIRTISPFLVIEFRLDRLEGNHLRVLDNLLDVYGFNITYEINAHANPVRPTSCIVVDCSFTGNCFANMDYTSFYCACFEGFSGPKCGTGPLCPTHANICKNGGTCSHVGANAATCLCAPGFTGDKCDVIAPDPRDSGCNGGGERASGEGSTIATGCVSQCPFDGQLGHVCNCPRASRPSTDKVRYEGTVRLANLPAVRNTLLTHSTRSLEALIEKQMSKYLKNSNLVKIEDLKVLNITAGAEVTFHFFGGRRDSAGVRTAMNRLVERGKLGNFTLANTQLATKQEPTLLLQNLMVNQHQPIRQGDEFSFSCVAQGSSYMTFNWYKDGAYINISKATRLMDSQVLSLDSDDRYTSILLINKATYLDKGLYTCQVVDWGVQQCKSMRVDILLAPEVKIIPMSITLQKGENVSIKCLSPNDRHHEKFGYNWTKNKSLFPLVPGKEVWEDLHPSGSILKIYNAQKSAIYTCLVHGRAESRSASVRVEVVNRTVVPLCTKEQHLDVLWPATAPGVDCIQKCPKNLLGNAVRLCTLVDTFNARWELPDFSDCSSNELYEIEDAFRSLTYGFQNTSGVETLQRCLDYIRNRKHMYPSEGRNVLHLVRSVFTYINITQAANEVAEATQTLYEIVNILLQHQHSITDQQDVMSLQHLVRSQALIWGSQLRTPAAAHLTLDALVLDVTSLESQSQHNLHIPLRATSYPAWFTDKIDIRIESGHSDTFGNNSFTVAIVTYKNFNQLLPVRYVMTTKEGTDLQYEIISRIIGIEVGHDMWRLLPKQGLFWVDLELAHVTSNYTEQGWNVTCAVSDMATSAHTWDLDSCVTRVLNVNSTRCTCTRTGTYAVLWTHHIIPKSASPERKEQQFVVLAGCVVCLALSVLTLGILLPYWWHHRTCLIFLKLQCCASLAGAMIVFIYAVRAPVHQDSYVIVATALEIFLLIGMSSHLSKLLIVYTEIVAIPAVRRHLQQTVVGVITGVPVLTVLSNLVAYRSLGLQLSSWWLVSDTMIFTIFVASAGVMILLFVFIYFSLMRKLHQLIDRHLDKTKALSKRIGLLSRSAVIFIMIVSMETASIFYINVPDAMYHYIFSFCCIIVGITIFVCYILKCESSLHMHFIRKFRLDKNIDENYSSESVNSPLSFFTKQDGEVEIDSAAPPRVGIRGYAAGASGDPTEGLLMTETRAKGFYRYTEAPSSTIETYVHSISDGSAEKLYPTDLNLQSQHLLDSQEIVDLERYQQSPKSYINLSHIPLSGNMYGEYLETDMNKKYPTDMRYYYPESANETPIMRPNPGKCYIRDYAPITQPDMLTTRVCVELGLVKSSPHSDLIGEANISVEAPANVMCSVDVEPMPEILENVPVICNGKETGEHEDSSTTESTTNSDITLPKVDTQNSVSEAERKQPEGKERGGIKVNDKGDNLDGMLDRISHDLDYLLNRTEDIESNPPQHAPPAMHGRKTSKPPGNSVIGQIREEDEEEDTLKTEDIDAGIAKTVC